MSDCSDNQKPGALMAPRRNKFFYGKMLDEMHLQMEQDYFNGKRWMLNRLGLGNGVLCGLNVTVKDKFICISRGVAIDPQGREIVVPESQLFDPWKVTDPAGSELTRTAAHKVYVCVAYRECATDYVPVLVTDCDNANQQAPSTIKESYCVMITEIPPEVLSLSVDPDLCKALTESADDETRRKGICEALSKRSCAEIGGSKCIVLASIELNSDGTIATPIDRCSARPVIYGNPELFEMLMCLSEQGGSGTVGPPGPTGSAGAGIDKVEIISLPCKEPPTAILVPDTDHLPNQILKLGIPGHCDQTLTKITDYNWTHDGTMTAANFFSTGLKITLSSNVTAASQSTPQSVNGWFQVSAEVWGGTLQRALLLSLALENNPFWSILAANGITIGAPGTIPVFRLHGDIALVNNGDPAFTNNMATFMPHGMPYNPPSISGVPPILYSPTFQMTLSWLNQLISDLQIIIRVTIKSDFLIDDKKRAVDGNHIGGKRPTGDGIQGGDFESWFRLIEIGGMEIPPNTPTGLSTLSAEKRREMEALAKMFPDITELEKLFKQGG